MNKALEKTTIIFSVHGVGRSIGVLVYWNAKKEES